MREGKEGRKAVRGIKNEFGLASSRDGLKDWRKFLFFKTPPMAIQKDPRREPGGQHFALRFVFGAGKENEREKKGGERKKCAKKEVIITI